MNLRRCPYCESLVDDKSTHCRFCGKEVGVGGGERPLPSVSHESDQAVGGARSCVACGRSIAFSASVCPYCGHDYRISIMQKPLVTRSLKPAVGGALIIVAGILAIAMGALYLVLDASYIEDLGYELPADMTAEDLESMMTGCGVVLFVFGAVALVGGYFGIRRRHFGFAIAGGVFGLLGIGFLFGALLALIGIILVAISREEFA